MSRYFLSRISVEGFRGINNEGDPLVLKFRPNAVNSVFAQNGTGKSSVFEALHYAIKGTVPRLTDMQAAEKPDSYLSNLFHSRGVATIELTLSPDDGGRDVGIEVQLRRDGVRTVSSSTGFVEPERLLSSLDEDFALMDYATFRKFIDDTALERGRSFSGLLGLSSYANVRSALRIIENTQAFKADFKIVELEVSLVALEREDGKYLGQFKAQYELATGLNPSSDESKWNDELLDHLRSIPLTTDLPETIGEVDFDNLRSVLLKAEGGEVRQQLLALTDEQTALANVPEESLPAARNATVLFALITEIAGLHESTAGAHFHRLQVAADAFLKSTDHWDLHVCPLCGGDLNSPIDATISGHLDTYNTLEGQLAALETAFLQGDLIDRLVALEDVKNLEAGHAASLSRVLRSTVEVGITKDDVTKATERVAHLEGLLVARKCSVAAAISELEKTVPPSLVHIASQVTAVEAARDALVERARAQRDLTELRTRHAVFLRWKDFVGRALAIFSTAETDLANRTLEDLRSEYQETFSDIMITPDIVPALSRAGSQEKLAVELSSFHGRRGVSARALLSESYRNALAISVYLSAAVKHNKAPRFVVLDDATSSFDSGHQFHLMEAIRTRFQQPQRPDGLQFIIFSHDVTLEKYFDRLNGETDWHHQKLQGWAPYSPISSHGQQPDRLRIDAESHLRSGRTTEGAGLIRQYLEFVLQKIIRQVRIPVPLDLSINDHSRMVQGCLDAITYAVDIHAAANQIILTTQQVADLKSRHAQAIAANWVSHYGTAGASAFTPASLLGILASIEALQRCFQYDESGTGAGPWKFYKSLKART